MKVHSCKQTSTALSPDPEAPCLNPRPPISPVQGTGPIRHDLSPCESNFLAYGVLRVFKASSFSFKDVTGVSSILGFSGSGVLGVFFLFCCFVPGGGGGEGVDVFGVLGVWGFRSLGFWGLKFRWF